GTAATPRLTPATPTRRAGSIAAITATDLSERRAGMSGGAENVDPVFRTRPRHARRGSCLETSARYFGFQSRASFCASASFSDDISPATWSRPFVAARARRLVEARGGEIEPHVRLDQILLHALAARIGEAEIVLRLAVALLGRALIPACRLVVVLRHAAA